MPIVALVGGRQSGKTTFFQYATNSLHNGPYKPSVLWLLAPTRDTKHIWVMDTGTEPHPTRYLSAFILFEGEWTCPPGLEHLPVLTWSGDNEETYRRLLAKFPIE